MRSYALEAITAASQAAIVNRINPTQLDPDDYALEKTEPYSQ